MNKLSRDVISNLISAIRQIEAAEGVSPELSVIRPRSERRNLTAQYKSRQVVVLISVDTLQQ